MARVARKHQKIFALTSGNNGVFGSAADGTKLLSDDLDTLQSKAAFDTGWLAAVIGNKKFPALEEFQALGYMATYQAAYLFQEGIPEYLATTTYYQNSIVKQPGTYKLYGSLTDGNVGNLLTDVVNWKLLIDLENNTLPSDLVYETHVQTLTNKTIQFPILSVLDSEFQIFDNADLLRIAQFDLGNLGHATYTYQFPQASATLVGLDTVQTLTNKTLGAGTVFPDGVVVGRGFGTYNTIETITDVIPADNTIPQITEGKQIISVTITPKRATNIIRAEFMCWCNNADTGLAANAAAIFRNDQSDCLNVAAVTQGANSQLYPEMLCVTAETVASTTSPLTFTVRVGPNGFRMFINALGGTSLYGGASKATLALTEFTAS